MKTLKKAKSILALALITTVGVSVLPKKSEAAVLFAAAAYPNTYSSSGLTVMAVTCFLVGLAYASPEFILLSDRSMKDQLALNLAKQLNTINDMNLISELADVVTKKYEAQKGDGSEKVVVTLSNAELSQIIANSSEVLSIDQIELLHKITQ